MGLTRLMVSRLMGLTRLMVSWLIRLYVYSAYTPYGFMDYKPIFLHGLHALWFHGSYAYISTWLTGCCLHGLHATIPTWLHDCLFYMVYTPLFLHGSHAIIRSKD